MLCEKDRKRDSDTEQRIHYFDGVLPFPVIQSFGKNVLWEKRESAIWHKAKNLLHWWHFTAFLLTVIDPSHSLRMTSYRLPHHGNRSFTFVQDDDWRFPHYDALPSPVILNGDKNAIWERQGSGTVTQSEESITLMTSCRLPHHGNRSFTFVQDDVLPWVPLLSDKRLLEIRHMEKESSF